MRLIFLTLLCFLFMRQGFCAFIPVTGIADSDIRKICVSSLDPSTVWVGSRNTLYKSMDSGKTFIAVQSFKDGDITHMFVDLRQVGVVYVVTSRHVYSFSKQLETIFTGVDEEFLRCAVICQDELFIASSLGLYHGNLETKQWQKVSGIQETGVNWVESVKNKVYVAADRGVYLWHEKNGLVRVLGARESEEDDPLRVVFQVIYIDQLDDSRILIGSSKGLFVSQDAGATWRKFSISGIDAVSIRCITQTPLEKNTVYLASDTGLFRVDIKRSASVTLFEGLDTAGVQWIEFDQKGVLYAATTRGLFVNTYFTPGQSSADLEDVLAGEPSIEQVQSSALRYNQTHPEKIKAWSRAVKFRALMPTVSLNYDKTVYSTYYSERPTVGPRDWGMSFSWDVGDLIWNSYEDDIDTRARLNTQLRFDILDEINRVYFERLRIKKELANNDLSGDELFGKQLRFKELTAIIDGYTGGLFTKLKK